MVTVMVVICAKPESLRQQITNDPKLGEFMFKVVESRNPNRPRGWAKLHSTENDRRGALNMEWDANTRILLCRVVNRGAGRPNSMVGDFVDYLLARHGRKIEAINIIPQ